MKILKKFLLFIFIVFVVIIGYVISNGYILYKESMDEASLEERIEEVHSIEHFTTLSELPDYYKKAVIAIEDHRFYSHGRC